jgi:hypothetical protein
MTNPKANWSRKLPYPVVLQDGTSLRTLEQAAQYVQTIGDRAERRAWQHAVRLLIEAAPGDDDLDPVTRQLTLALMLDGKIDFRSTNAGKLNSSNDG